MSSEPICSSVEWHSFMRYESIEKVLVSFYLHHIFSMPDNVSQTRSIQVQCIQLSKVDASCAAVNVDEKKEGRVRSRGRKRRRTEFVVHRNECSLDFFIFFSKSIVEVSQAPFNESK